MFRLHAEYDTAGDQQHAINTLVGQLEGGQERCILLGVTGPGKTFAMAKVIERMQLPTLILSHNKTLARQIWQEMSSLFPENSVEYFVSYYDYYQPEAYIPRTDTYIEKDADINDEIDKLRHAATRAILSRRDTIIVASVSCIYGLGSPDEYQGFVMRIEKGQTLNRHRLLRRLVEMQYERNDMNLTRGKFRVRGDTIEILPVHDEIAIRIDFFGEQVDRILTLDPLTGEILSEGGVIDIYPGKHFVTPAEKLLMGIQDIEEEMAERVKLLKSQGKLVEAQRLESRTNYDLEMLRETGYCSGVENYSRPLAQRTAGSTPWTLMDYFPDDFILFIDESHMTIPQLNGMYRGDISRKQTLVDYGYRLPSALDNRPLSFGEFEKHIEQAIYVSATPGPYETGKAEQLVEQVIRPTGLLDPTIQVKPTQGQIDDLLQEIKARVAKSERCLVTTLTKRMAEELADYLREMNVKTQYLHSEIDTLERSERLRDLRLGVYDVVVGINLLREGLDLPEVSLVAILDADKEGYLRSQSALIQTMGRAARHSEGHVIMYADNITRSMSMAINETDRRRKIQQEHNLRHNITPVGIHKAVADITDRLRPENYSENTDFSWENMPKDEIFRLVKDLESKMKQAAKNFEFEKAALLRDEIVEIRRELSGPQ